MVTAECLPSLWSLGTTSTISVSPGTFNFHMQHHTSLSRSSSTVSKVGPDTVFCSALCPNHPFPGAQQGAVPARNTNRACGNWRCRILSHFVVWAAVAGEACLGVLRMVTVCKRNQHAAMVFSNTVRPPPVPVIGTHPIVHGNPPPQVGKKNPDGKPFQIEVGVSGGFH